MLVTDFKKIMEVFGPLLKVHLLFGSMSCAHVLFTEQTKKSEAIKLGYSEVFRQLDRYTEVLTEVMRNRHDSSFSVNEILETLRLTVMLESPHLDFPQEYLRVLMVISSKWYCDQIIHETDEFYDKISKEAAELKTFILSDNQPLEYGEKVVAVLDDLLLFPGNIAKAFKLMHGSDIATSTGNYILT